MSDDDTTLATEPLIVATVLMNVGIAAIAAGAPVAQQACGHSDATIALAAALSSFGTVVGALLAGRFANGRAVWLASMVLLAIGATIGVGVVGNDASLWIVPARLLDGLALGGALVASETLLLHAVTDARRARALALYAVATAAGFIVGPAIAGVVVGAGRGDGAFVVGVGGAIGTIIVVAIAVCAHTTRTVVATAAVRSTTPSTTPWSVLWRRNIVPCSTTSLYGVFQGAALVLLPLRLLADGVDGAGATGIVAFYALGMLLCTWPVSLLGARFTTTTVMVVLCLVGGGTAIVMALTSLQSLPLRALLAAVTGGTVATLSPLSLALQGRRNPASDIARVNSLYNACYAAGLLLGPLLVATLIGVLGASTLLTALGGAWLVHACFIVVVERVSPTPARAGFTMSVSSPLEAE